MLLSMAHLPNLKKETMAEVALTTKVGRHPFETSTCKPMVPSTQLLLVIIELFLLRFPQVTPFLRGGISWYATIKSMQFMALPLGSAECGTSRILYCTFWYWLWIEQTWILTTASISTCQILLFRGALLEPAGHYAEGAQQARAVP